MKIPIIYFRGDTSPLVVRVSQDSPFYPFVRLWQYNHASDFNCIDYSKVKLIDVVK